MPKTLQLTIPESPSELLEVLNDETKVKALMNDPEKFKEFVGEYAKSVHEDDPGIEKQSDEQTRRIFQEMLDDHGFDGKMKRLPMDDGIANRMARNGGSDLPWFKGTNPLTEMTPARRAKALAMYEPESAGAHLDGMFERMGNVYQTASAIVDPYWLTQELKGITDARMKVLNESQGDGGGFIVPEEMRVQLLSIALEQSIIRSRAMVVPMTSLTLKIPAIRDTSHATTVFGGIQGYFVPESGSFTASEPTFAQVQLTAKKLTGLTRVTNELIRDSALALEALLNTLFAQAIAYFEEDHFINGVGSGQPTGILNADAMVVVSKETGQAVTTIVWENLIKMYSRMLPSSLGNAIWYAHMDTFPQLATMALNVGTGGSAVWINNGVSGPPATILGRPVFFTEKAQTLGTAGDIVFVDPSYYLIGDRQTLEVASSIHTRFTTDETEFRFIERIDGRPWIDSALTPRNGTNTLSPFVDLATRS